MTKGELQQKYLASTGRGLERESPPTRLFEKANTFPINQVSRRYERLEIARGASPAGIERVETGAIEEEFGA